MKPKSLKIHLCVTRYRSKDAVDLTEVQAIVISHGHFDHYGGTISALNAISKKDLPVYTHPELFNPRAFGEKELTYVSYNLTTEEIEKHGGKVIESAEPHIFLMIMLSFLVKF